MGEMGDYTRHYAIPDRPYTLCGERIYPRDVQADWPDCVSCMREVKRYWGDTGVEVARNVNTRRLMERDEHVREIMTMIEREEWIG